MQMMRDKEVPRDHEGAILSANVKVLSNPNGNRGWWHHLSNYHTKQSLDRLTQRATDSLDGGLSGHKTIRLGEYNTNKEAVWKLKSLSNTPTMGLKTKKRDLLVRY